MRINEGLGSDGDGNRGARIDVVAGIAVKAGLARLPSQQRQSSTRSSVSNDWTRMGTHQVFEVNLR